MDECVCSVCVCVKCVSMLFDGTFAKEWQEFALEEVWRFLMEVHVNVGCRLYVGVIF